MGHLFAQLTEQPFECGAVKSENRRLERILSMLVVFGTERDGCRLGTLSSRSGCLWRGHHPDHGFHPPAPFVGCPDS